MKHLLLALLLSPLTAQAAPSLFSHQGRLSDASGVSLDAQHALEFRLYDSAQSGTLLWSERHDAVDFNNGFFQVEIGSVAPFDPDFFDQNSTLYLAMVVDDGAELSTRTALLSVPWALHATTATNLSGGTVDATSVTINGITVINSDGLISPNSIGAGLELNDQLNQLGCGDHDTIEKVGTSWMCIPQNEHLHRAEQLSSGTLSIDRIPTGRAEGTVAPGLHVHEGADITSVLAASTIPSLNANKITAGKLPEARIANLNANKITAGTLADARIPDLSANKITSGTFGDAFISDLDASKLTGTLPTATIPGLSAGQIVSGTFGDAFISDVAASKVTGTLGAARIPNLNANKITAGKLPEARIANLGAGKITTGTFAAARIPNLNANKITAGTLAVARIPTLNASKIQTGTTANDLALGDHSHSQFTGNISVTNGGVKPGQTSCGGADDGLIQWSGSALQVCVQSQWVDIVIGTYGSSASNPASSCLDIKTRTQSSADGLYWLAGTSGTYRAYCDMTTDGGGWTLMGTIDGGGSNVWSSKIGLWGNTNTTGNPDSPFADFKSEAWFNVDITSAEVLYERRYAGAVKTQSKLSNNCLHNKARFVDLFSTWDTNLRCGIAQITTLMPESSTTGLASAVYQDGSGTDGIGGSGTNGWCWNGGDNANNTFLGHAGYNQSAYSTCVAAGHLSYVGVWQTGSVQYTVADVTGTNKFYGTDYTQTAVSFYVR